MRKKIWIPVLLVLAAGWGAFSIDWKSPRRDGYCAFCDASIVERQMVYRGKLASVLATHKPTVRGHLLVIPNRHVETLDGLTEAEFAEVGSLLKKAHITEEYILLQKNGILAGQTVPHVHFHLLPRDNTVGTAAYIALFLAAPWKKALTAEEMKVYVNELSGQLGERLE